MTSLHSRPPAPERGSTQAPGDRGCSASTGRSGLDRRPEAGATTCGWCQPLQNTTHPRSGERLDKSIALIQRGITRCICASRVTACHSTLFTLRSGHSGLGIYTTQRDAARRKGFFRFRSGWPAAWNGVIKVFPGAATPVQPLHDPVPQGLPCPVGGAAGTASDQNRSSAMFRPMTPSPSPGPCASCPF